MRFGSRGGFRSGGGFSGGGGGRRSGGFGGGFEKPVKEGEEYDVEISEVGSRGDGIAKIKNFIIFVPGTQKGEKVRIRISQVKAKSAVGEVVGGKASAPVAAATGEVAASGDETIH